MAWDIRTRDTLAEDDVRAVQVVSRRACDAEVRGVGVVSAVGDGEQVLRACGPTAGLWGGEAGGKVGLGVGSRIRHIGPLLEVESRYCMRAVGWWGGAWSEVQSH
eukprot:358644-Chlamydomonas_euryale.AAC.3